MNIQVTRNGNGILKLWNLIAQIKRGQLMLHVFGISFIFALIGDQCAHLGFIRYLTRRNVYPPPDVYSPA